jgi:predicted ABC-type ATPase
MPPTVYIVAGPNGAGKTTFARKFLPRYAHCRNFVNADLIAQGIAPFAPESAAFRAGRMLINEIDNFAKRKADFGFETTLSGRANLSLLRQLRSQGYQVRIFFLWPMSLEVSLSRIQERVMRGGHDVPESIVRRRFDRSIRNFLVYYRPLANSWILFDNSCAAPDVIALEMGGVSTIMKLGAYKDLTSLYGVK